MTDEYANQPPESAWKFVEQLKSPLHKKIAWKRVAHKNEINLQNGVALEFAFPDPDGKLATAYADFRQFLAAGGIPADGGYKITTVRTRTSCFEEYIIETDAAACRILANDTEGIRRALVFLEDTILRSGGPCLAPGKTSRKPFIKTRISRCFFGPIKRPPMNRDELMDDVNYYPDEYLNRLAHEGINGLWLSIEFRDLCPSRFFPQHGKDSQRQIAKLRQTVRQCARFGIKIYVFCNEPVGFGYRKDMLPVASLENRPWFAGHKGDEYLDVLAHYFCTSSRQGQEYLEECTNFIFSQVPGLGGMINLAFGEKPTNCYSRAHNFFNNNCPRCSKRKPWEVYRDTLAAMARGIKKAAPQAEMIAWLYASSILTDNRSSVEDKQEVLRQIVAHAPRDVVMQLNFESNGKVRQLGRECIAYDYWLAWPGPSDHFAACAASARKALVRCAAKIQVGCSHENATIPFMPVPGSLFRKYRAMRKLGVSAVMQCWYFGNYPGLMNKTAGELSFLPLPSGENEFLENLARIDWCGNHRKIARAWKYFMRGYSNIPISLFFTHFGPLHCSIVWPLHLFPVDQYIAPSWCFGYPDSGDRIGECIGFNHSLEDVLILLGRMDRYWGKGLKIIAGIERQYAANSERRLDIGLYKAIGCQIRSTLNVFRFYNLREKLPGLPQAQQLKILAIMATLVRAEIRNCEAMKELCLQDTRLGFHSEAEGYKFFPAKLDWRAGLLNTLLAKDFPKVRSCIKGGRLLFPEYTGISPQGKTYHCGKKSDDAVIAQFVERTGSWRAWRRSNELVFEVKWTPHKKGDIMTLTMEPRRLWPVIRFEISANGNISHFKGVFQQTKIMAPWNGETRKSGEQFLSIFSIPFKTIPWFDGRKPLRINIYQTDATRHYLAGWIKHTPLVHVKNWTVINSADLGWFFIG